MRALRDMEEWRVTVWDDLPGRKQRVVTFQAFGSEAYMRAEYDARTPRLGGSVYLCRRKAGKTRFANVAVKP